MIAPPSATRSDLVLAFIVLQVFKDILALSACIVAYHIAVKTKHPQLKAPK